MHAKLDSLVNLAEGRPKNLPVCGNLSWAANVIYKRSDWCSDNLVRHLPTHDVQQQISMRKSSKLQVGCKPPSVVTYVDAG